MLTESEFTNRLMGSPKETTITRYVVDQSEDGNSLIEFSDGEVAVCTENQYWLNDGEPRSYKWMGDCPYGKLIEDFRPGEVKVTVGFNEEDAAKFASMAGFNP